MPSVGKTEKGGIGDGVYRGTYDVQGLDDIPCYSLTCSMVMQRAGTILKKFFREHGLEATLTLSIIQKNWEGLVGRTIAQHTFPARLTGKTLSVTVDTPQWMHHLSFYKQELCGKLRNHKVHEIRLKLGQLPLKADSRHGVPGAHLSDEDIRFIEETIGYLRDDELKKRFRTLLTHALGRGKG